MVFFLLFYFDSLEKLNIFLIHEKPSKIYRHNLSIYYFIFCCWKVSAFYCIFWLYLFGFSFENNNLVPFFFFFEFFSFAFELHIHGLIFRWFFVNCEKFTIWMRNVSTHHCEKIFHFIFTLKCFSAYRKSKWALVGWQESDFIVSISTATPIFNGFVGASKCWKENNKKCLKHIIYAKRSDQYICYAHRM